MSRCTCSRVGVAWKVRGATEAAFARGIETDSRVPASGGVDRIVGELRRHLLVVVGE